MAFKRAEDCLALGTASSASAQRLRTFREYVRELCGEELSARPFTEHANRTVAAALTEARAQVAREPSLSRRAGEVDLDAKTRVTHGRETIAELASGEFEAFAPGFSTWIDRLVGS